MKKTLSMIAILTVAVFAETDFTEINFEEIKPTKQETDKIQGNVDDMHIRDKEIRVINLSIDKHKESIYTKLKEMEKIFDNYECERQKSAISLMKLKLHKSNDIPNDELEESKIILQRLQSKLTQKCEGN